MSTPAFQGVIGDDWRSSTPWWPPEPTPPAGAPNVVMIVLDDVGFAQLGCYGSDLATPTIDALANRGVRMANFHSTALCSPTRSCLLTGRNHHRNGLGRVADLAMGYPGYDAETPIENGYLSQVLQANGYATYAVGKWHLTPDDQAHMGGSRRSWPLGRGFDRWYGFHGGETHQFVPALYCDNHAVTPPRSMHEGYHLTEDLADQAIRHLADLRSVDEDKRFFLYFATGACHAPHHAPTEWIERERGRFDAGWDRWREATFARQQALGIVPAHAELAPRPSWVPAWDDLDATARRVAARFMECFAAFLAHTDAQIARVLAFLERTGDLDDTLVVLVSDNGASGEGGAGGSLNDVRPFNFDPTSPEELAARIDEIGTPSTHNNYPWGWTMAGNTPFKRWKREVHEGGIAVPCIFAWPGTVDASGAIRHQYAHAIDVPTTVLGLVGIDPPDTIDHVPQSRIDGVDFSAVLTPDGEHLAGPRTTQHYEMLGSRAIYHDGWKAVTFKPIGPFYDDGIDPNAPFEEDRWELYDLRRDPTELHDLAADHPDRLAELVAIWWDEARANQVLPLDNRVLHTIAHPKPDRRRERRRATFWPDAAPVPEPVAPNVKNRFHHITAYLTIPEADPATHTAGPTPEGVLLAQGSALGGFSLHLYQGRLRYVFNLYGRHRDVIEAADPVPPGERRLAMRYQPAPTGGGAVELLIDDVVVAEGSIARFTAVAFNHTGTGLTCGYEQGPAVGEGYVAPFRCNVALHRVTLEVGDPVAEDPAVVVDRILSAQ